MGTRVENTLCVTRVRGTYPYYLNKRFRKCGTIVHPELFNYKLNIFNTGNTRIHIHILCTIVFVFRNDLHVAYRI